MANTTITGYFLRRRLKRHLVLRIWNLVRDVIMGRELAAVWQPTTVCLCCQVQIEVTATFCSRCGTLQRHDNILTVGRVQRKRETEKLPVVLPATPMPPIRETEAINRLTVISDEATTRLYSVRIGELRPIHQYLELQKLAKQAQLTQLEEQLVQQRAEYPQSRYTSDLELVAARLRKELAEK